MAPEGSRTARRPGQRGFFGTPVVFLPPIRVCCFPGSLFADLVARLCTSTGPGPKFKHLSEARAGRNSLKV